MKMQSTAPYPAHFCDPMERQMGTHATGGSGVALDRRSLLKLGGAALGASVLAPALAACGSSGSSSSASGGVTQLTFASAKFYGKSNMQQIVESYNTSQSKIHVNYRELPPPSSSTEVHQQLVQSVGRKDGSVDVFTQDIVWIAEFAGAGWALPLDDYVDATEKSAYFPGLIESCTWQGKLTALPWFVDSGMLYYRKDLLDAAGTEVPTTWEELQTAAQSLMSSGKVQYGFLWQGKQAEVLVCDLVEFVGSAGGSILGSDGKTVQLADAGATKGVQFMVDTLNGSKISPKDLLSWDEEPSRRPFTAGQAAFLRNWSYVYAIAQDASQSKVVDKVAVAPLPAFSGGKSTACLGGYQFGVSTASKNKEAAVEFVKWMSSPATQLKFATEVGLAPSRSAVFDDPALAAANPFMVKLKNVFVGGAPRPVTPKYPQVSLALQSGVSKALSSGDVQGSLNDTKSQIERVVA
jgi:multiple sugar transport system substrate-binding protein